jgi:hypothetical protein
MGKRETYEYIHDNPSFEFRTIDYTNNPLVIAQHHHMTAINSALEIDLTGQATAESLGKLFYSGIGGQADFMRGAPLAPHGKTILTIQSTAENETVSRIVPFLREGTGVTLHRGDVHYIVSEYGIAYLHGKNIRERSMELISIAHPKFRPWLIEEAKKNALIYKDQAFIPGERGEYPEFLETHRITRTGLNVFFRPVKMSDESILQDFLYSLSDDSLYRRFISSRKDMPHERVQQYVIIDYTKEITLLAVSQEGNMEVTLGIGQYPSMKGPIRQRLPLWWGTSIKTKESAPSSSPISLSWPKGRDYSDLPQKCSGEIRPCSTSSRRWGLIRKRGETRGLSS